MMSFLRDISPDSCFCWKAGRVENMRQRVETTTKRQESIATTWIMRQGWSMFLLETNPYQL